MPKRVIPKTWPLNLRFIHTAHILTSCNRPAASDGGCRSTVRTIHIYARIRIAAIRIGDLLYENGARSLDSEHAVNLEDMIRDGLRVVDADCPHHLQQPRAVDKQIHARRGLLHLVQHRAVDSRDSVDDNRGEHLLEALQREVLVVPAVPRGCERGEKRETNAWRRKRRAAGERCGVRKRR